MEEDVILSMINTARLKKQTYYYYLRIRQIFFTDQVGDSIQKDVIVECKCEPLSPKSYGVWSKLFR